jgi:hypothetical protein
VRQASWCVPAGGSPVAMVSEQSVQAHFDPFSGDPRLLVSASGRRTIKHDEEGRFRFSEADRLLGVGDASRYCGQYSLFSCKLDTSFVEIIPEVKRRCCLGAMAASGPSPGQLSHANALLVAQEIRPAASASNQAIDRAERAAINAVWRSSRAIFRQGLSAYTQKESPAQGGASVLTCGGKTQRAA